jgi:hypothetical protein
MSPEKRALVLVMAKMALVDGKLAEEETGVLEAMLEGEASIDAMLTQAAQNSFAQLIAPIAHYPDRFFIALRAACLARVDDELAGSEAEVFEQLIRDLGIESADRALILEGARSTQDPGLQPNPPIEQVVGESSFA